MSTNKRPQKLNISDYVSDLEKTESVNSSILSERENERSFFPSKERTKISTPYEKKNMQLVLSPALHKRLAMIKVVSGVTMQNLCISAVYRFLEEYGLENDLSEEGKEYVRHIVKTQIHG